MPHNPFTFEDDEDKPKKPNKLDEIKDEIMDGLLRTSFPPRAPSPPDKAFLTKRPPWMRRDYSHELDLLEQALNSPKGIGLAGYEDKQAARAARFDFYRARSWHKRTNTEAASLDMPLEEQGNYYMYACKYDKLKITVYYSAKGWALAIKPGDEITVLELDE